MTATPQRHSASAASSFSPSETAELLATASGLPDDWILLVEPPHGQLSIVPVAGARFRYACMVATSRGRAGGTYSRRLWSPLP